MSPKLMTSQEVITGKDMDERKRADAGGGVEPRQGRDATSRFGGNVVGRELSPGEAAGAALSGGRREGADAPQRRGRLESCAAHGRTRAGVGARAGEVRRGGGGGGGGGGGRRAVGQWRRRGGKPTHRAAGG